MRWISVLFMALCVGCGHRPSDSSGECNGMCGECASVWREAQATEHRAPPVTAGIAELKEPRQDGDGIFWNRTAWSEAVTPLSYNLHVTYDPTEALTYAYVLTLNNRGAKPVICDLGIYSDGRLRKETSIEADAYRGGKREGVIIMDERGAHTFEAKITKVHDLGK